MAYVYNSLLTVQKWRSATQVVDTANTDYDDAPGAGVLKLMTAGAQGGVLVGLWAIPRANAVATQLQVYSVIPAVHATNKRLIDSAVSGAYIFASGTKIPKYDFGYTADAGLPLDPLEELWVGIGLSSAFVWTARWGDY